MLSILQRFFLLLRYANFTDKISNKFREAFLADLGKQDKIYTQKYAQAHKTD